MSDTTDKRSLSSPLRSTSELKRNLAETAWHDLQHIDKIIPEFLLLKKNQKKKKNHFEEEPFWFALYSNKQMGKWSRFRPWSHLSLINSEDCVWRRREAVRSFDRRCGELHFVLCCISCPFLDLWSAFRSLSSLHPSTPRHVTPLFPAKNSH